MPPKILKPSQLDEAVELIASGGLVAFPTNTVYGVAALADNEFSNARLREFKGGRAERFSLHSGSVESALAFAGQVNAAEEFALRALTPHGVTLVIAAGASSLGVRVVRHELGSALLDAIPAPVVATSANPHGQPPLSDPQAIAALGIDAVLDGGVLPIRPASTVARLLPCGLQILREGAVGPDALAQMYTRAIQFICLGNLNRSAFAHRLLEAMQDWLKAQVEAFVPAFLPSSSGLIARSRNRPPPQMQQAAAEYSVSLGGHVPTEFDPRALPPLCVSMGREVEPHVSENSPAQLIAWEIEDPMGQPAGVYARTAKQVIEHLRRDLLARWADGGDAAKTFESRFFGRAG